MKFKLVNPFTATKLDTSTVVGGVTWGLFVVAMVALIQNISKMVGLKTPIDTSITGSKLFEDVAVNNTPQDNFY